MPYRVKCKIWKDDMSTPIIWPYIVNFHPIGPGGYEDQQDDGGSPYRVYSWRVNNFQDELWFLFGLNVEILPEGSSWFYSFLNSVLGVKKTTVKLWYTLDDIPLIVWNFEFIWSRYAFSYCQSTDDSQSEAYDADLYDETSPFLDEFPKIEDGDDRVYWKLNFQGAGAYAKFPLRVPVLPVLNTPQPEIVLPF